MFLGGTVGDIGPKSQGIGVLPLAFKGASVDDGGREGLGRALIAGLPLGVEGAAGRGLFVEAQEFVKGFWGVGFVLEDFCPAFDQDGGAITALDLPVVFGICARKSPPAKEEKTKKIQPRKAQYVSQCRALCSRMDEFGAYSPRSIRQLDCIAAEHQGQTHRKPRSKRREEAEKAHLRAARSSAG